MKDLRKTLGLALVALLTLAVFAVSRPAAAASVEPVFYDGNPSCEDLGYTYGLKFNYPDDSTGGTYNIGTGTVTWSTDGVYVDWSSTFGLDAVIVKGGSNANLYAYSPESFGDTDLASPINPNNGRPYDLSHVEFCYDYEVQVSKTAETSFTRTWSWSIVKDGDQTELLLSQGQVFDVHYTVTVNATPQDSAWAVSGEITITNPDPNYIATITSVTDSVSGIDATVDCPAYTVAPGDTLTCTYSADLPDGDPRTNVATVTTSGPVGGGSGQAAVTFGDPTSEIDECINVTDDLYGTLGTVCAGDADKTFEYTLSLGADVPLECGENVVTNTASFETNDTGATDSDDHTVVVTVSCNQGCTLTPGYWKTHADPSRKQFDATWNSIGPNTPFYSSGKSYLEVLNTPPAGNAYYILAHAYIAAKLNTLNGAATTPEVAAAIAWSENFFATNSPATKLSKDLRAQVIARATTLDNYNNGLIGPGHCSE